MPDGRLFSLDTPAGGGSGDAAVTRASEAEQKLALFRQRFAVRTDVFALRWENPSTGKSGWMPARRGGREGPLRPLTDEVLRSHLETGDHVGVYPLRPGDTESHFGSPLDWRSTAFAIGISPHLLREMVGVADRDQNTPARTGDLATVASLRALPNHGHRRSSRPRPA